MSETSQPGGESADQELVEQIGRLQTGTNVEIVVDGQAYTGHIEEAYYAARGNRPGDRESIEFQLGDLNTGLTRFLLYENRRPGGDWELTVTEITARNDENVPSDTDDLGKLDAVKERQVSADA